MHLFPDFECTKVRQFFYSKSKESDSAVVYTGSEAKNSRSSIFILFTASTVVTLLHQTILKLKLYIMKKLLLIPVLAILFASCSNSDTTSDPQADLTTKTNMVAQSNWIITQYTDSGKDETSDYTGYTFTFNSDGTLIAMFEGTPTNGTWLLAQGSTTPDDSGNDLTDDKLNKFTINITGNKLMDKLAHKWLVDKITATEIYLRDDNVASNELLRFGK
jgi:hypothetical protein